jgi:hypothetical protein
MTKLNNESSSAEAKKDGEEEAVVLGAKGRAELRERLLDGVVVVFRSLQ